MNNNDWIRRMALLCEDVSEEEAGNLTDEQLTLKEFFQKAIREDAELMVTFNKVTDGKERTAVFCNNSGYSASFKDAVQVGPETLKKIERNHDRVFQHEVKYVGCLVTFPEKITEHSNANGVFKRNRAGDGTEWQWRRLYIEQIINVKYNGRIVWQNDETFNFNLIGKDGVQTRVVPADEWFAKAKARQDAIDARVRDDAERKAIRDKAKEMAKGLSDDDVGVSLGCMNGWSYKYDDEVIRRDAIMIKHDQLARVKPEEHKMHGTEPYGHHSGMHTLQCTCGFGYSWDTSD